MARRRRRRVYALGRLVDTPQLRPTPEFRPESVGEEEYRVDLMVERHVLPPITRDEVQQHPVLADLEVLHRPWGGTNLSMTREQWWAVRELAPLEPSQPPGCAKDRWCTGPRGSLTLSTVSTTNGWRAARHRRAVADIAGMACKRRTVTATCGGLY
jgi:hypothetical protein